MLEPSTFPKRALVQGHENGRLSPESNLVAEELRARLIPVVIKTTDEMSAEGWPVSENDLVVGDFDWTRHALRKLCVVFPEPPDYPDCLRELLFRRIWKSTLGELNVLLLSDPTNSIFIKPAEDTKAFSGLQASVDWMDYLMQQFPPSFPILCSEMVEMISEYRVYVVDGNIRSICHYKGPTEISLDIVVVEDAVRKLFESEEGKELTGCGIDFAVMKIDGKYLTGLVEVNDGYSLGAYDGISAKDYTDMLIARWIALLKGMPSPV